VAEPLVLIDYEFHFASGDPLFVTVTEGRDEVRHRADHVYVVVRQDTGTEDILTVFHNKLNGIRQTRREIPPEPQLPGAEHGT
jgi:hypothetical protein